jgi:PAS domain S-box-containing protein
MPHLSLMESLPVETAPKKSGVARHPLATRPSDDQPRLRDLIDCAALQSMLDDLNRLTGLAVAIVDVRGELLVVSGWQDICSEFHRKHPKTFENCRLSDTVLSQGGEPGAFKPYRCANGMLDMATPIEVNGCHVGNLFFGQFFLEGKEPDREQFRLQARRFGFDEDAYLAALDRVPRRTRGAVDTAMAFYAKFATMVSSLGHSNLELTRAVGESQDALEAQRRNQQELAALQQRERERAASLQTINQVVGSLVSETDGVTICRMIGDAVHRLVPGAIVISSSVTPDGERLKIAGISGGAKYLAIAGKLLGGDPLALEFPLASFRPAESAWFRSGKLQHIPNDIYTLAAGKLPRRVCRAVERHVGIAEMQAIGFSWAGHHFGALALLLPTGVSIGEHAEAIELIVRQASSALQRATSELALASSEAQLRTLVDTIPDLVWLKDPDGVFLACNREFERLFGAKEADIVGKTDNDFTDADQAEFFRQKDREAMAAGTPTVNQEWVTYAEDGRHALLETIKTPMKGADGRLTGVLGIARDITEHKRTESELHEREDLLRLTLDQAPIGVVVADLDFRFLQVNEALCRFLGRSAEELAGRSFCDISFPDDLATDRSGLDELIAGTSELHSRDKRYVRGDGSVVWGHVTARLLRDESGQPLHFVTMIEDINERKRAEEAEKVAVQCVTSALDATVVAMGAMAEMRDPYTAGHERRVTQLAIAIAEKLGLAETRLAALRLACSVHDIGKISVPAEILSKPGRLTELEFEIVKRHPQVGYDILSGIDFGMPVAQIVLAHHERLDGSGYPNGLTDGDMPLEARILAVSDVVEAMASHRPYRAALGLDPALDEIVRGRGRLYDPDVVDACCKLFRDGGFAFEF